MRGRSPRLLVAVAAAVVLVLALGAVVLFNSDDVTVTTDSATEPTGDDGSQGSSSEPATAIEAYVEAYNSGSVDAVMELFTEESVISNHPFGRAEGLAAIRSNQILDIRAAATTDAYSISNVEVIGDSVNWDHRWTNNRGEESCAVGNSAVVQDGRIVSWAWPPTELCG